MKKNRVDYFTEILFLLNLLHRKASSCFSSLLQGIINKRSNLCYVEGPLNLYDRYDRDKGAFEFGDVNADGEVCNFNSHVLGRLTQMLVKDMPVKAETASDPVEISKFIPVTFDDIP